MTIIRNNPQPRLSASVAYGDPAVPLRADAKSNEDDIVYKPVKYWKIDALLAAARER